MTETTSNKIPLGTIAPDFQLPDSITADLYSLQDIQGERGTVIMFICNSCPFVKHVAEEIVRVSNDYRVLGFGFAAISSNDVKEVPEDHPDLMYRFARKYNFNFPYLYDRDQTTAIDYKAACTPDFYLFNADLQLVYHGQLDNSRPGNGIPSNGRELREALDAILGNKRVSPVQKPSIGCSIKWKYR